MNWLKKVWKAVKKRLPDIITDVLTSEKKSADQDGKPGPGDPFDAGR